jgi:glycosyltransferase involved in cell wall biosynthesis
VRVAHFVQRYPPALGGSEAYFARLSRYLAAAGDHVTVFTTTAVDLEGFWHSRGRCLRPGRQVENGVEVRRYGLWRLPGHTRFLKALSFLPHRGWQCLTRSCNPIAPGMLHDALRGNERFDLVHATAFPYGWIVACGRLLARRLGVPLVLTPFLHLGDPHDPRDRTRRAYLHPCLLAVARAADRVFVQTEQERQALLDRGFAEERLILQGMGFDPESCTGGDREGIRAQWGVGRNDCVVGHLANNSFEKGTIDLLKAANRVARYNGRLHVVLAGPEMPNFRSFWRTYRPAVPVRRLGVLNAQQKRDFFAGIDVFALPSRSDSFGIVLLEAWANGAATVGYDAGGIGGVIRHEQDGLLVRCGDLQGLATALQRLTAEPELRRRFGASGRERARRDYGWEDKLDLVYSVYRELANPNATTCISPAENSLASLETPWYHRANRLT